ncbi:MAG: LamG domain-containing protein [Anaerolineales bacterium]|nr:LamG domain-containing protein [Anaerolineales bacterium]
MKLSPRAYRRLSAVGVLGALLVFAIGGLAPVDQAAATGSGPLACPADLAAFWQLDETGPSTYYDTAAAHDATCSPGECPLAVTGLVGGGQRFDSLSEVNVPASTDFDWGVDDSFSIEFWMRTAAASSCSGNHVIMGRNVSSQTGLHWWIGCVDGGDPIFLVQDEGGIQAEVTAAGFDVANGAWHHVAGVRDAVADVLQLYVDGTLRATTPTTYTQGFASATAPLNIGWLNTGSDYHYEGTLDELAVYSRALAGTEIEEHRSGNLGGYDVCTIPPTATATSTSTATSTATATATSTTVPVLSERLFVPWASK